MRTDSNFRICRPRVRHAADDRARQARGDPRRARPAAGWKPWRRPARQGDAAAAHRRAGRTDRGGAPSIGTLVARSGYLDAASRPRCPTPTSATRSARPWPIPSVHRASSSTSIRLAARSAGCSIWSKQIARPRRERQAALGGRQRRRAVGCLCDRAAPPTASM